jgi:hypothetical protein
MEVARGTLQAALLLAGLLALPAFGATHRDPAVAREFQKEHPCPSTGKRTGSCPGYIRDHIKPLCAGGADRVSNMQWQTTAEAKKKDKVERKQCGR